MVHRECRLQTTLFHISSIKLVILEYLFDATSCVNNKQLYILYMIALKASLVLLAETKYFMQHCMLSFTPNDNENSKHVLVHLSEPVLRKHYYFPIIYLILHFIFLTRTLQICLHATCNCPSRLNKFSFLIPFVKFHTDICAKNAHFFVLCF